MVRAVNKMVGGTASVPSGSSITTASTEKGKAPGTVKGKKTPLCGLCGKVASFAGVQWRSFVSNTQNERAPDGDMRAECKVLHVPFRAKMDWNDSKDRARTPDGTKDIKEVSDNRKGSTMDFPVQVTEEGHMGWNIKRRLWIAITVELTKLCGTPRSNRLLRAPSFSAVRNWRRFRNGLGLLHGRHRAPAARDDPVPARRRVEAQAPHEVTMTVASRHKVNWCCRTARRLTCQAQAIMFTSVDLHTVQEYHDKVYGDTRKLAGDSRS